jgi:hypothetical protein
VSGEINPTLQVNPTVLKTSLFGSDVSDYVD